MFARVFSKVFSGVFPWVFSGVFSGQFPSDFLLKSLLKKRSLMFPGQCPVCSHIKNDVTSWKRSLRPQGQFPSYFLISIYGKSLEMEPEASRASSFSPSSKTVTTLYRNGVGQIQRSLRGLFPQAVQWFSLFFNCFHCCSIVFSMVVQCFFSGSGAEPGRKLWESRQG